VTARLAIGLAAALARSCLTWGLDRSPWRFPIAIHSLTWHGVRAGFFDWVPGSARPGTGVRGTRGSGRTFRATPGAHPHDGQDSVALGHAVAGPKIRDQAPSSGR
jgi:hypothetical protein